MKTVSPSLRGYPLVGVLPRLRRDPLGFFLEALGHGDVVALRVGPYRSFLLSHPDAIQHVLHDHHRNYHKSPLYEDVRTSFGDGLLTSEDQLWVRQRRLAQPAFHHRRLAELVGPMVEATEGMLERWSLRVGRPEPVDAALEMMHLTQEIIVRSMFSARLAEKDVAAIDRDWRLLNEHIGRAFWSWTQLAKRLPTASNRRFWGARRRLAGLVDRIIAERRRRGTDEGDLLSMLLLARDTETGEVMSDDQIRAEVMTFLFAGHETTAIALAWTWYLLARSPSVETRLLQELDTVLNGRAPSLADLDRLVFVKNVLQEAMRLYPPAWGISRLALADDEIRGHSVPAGSIVFIVPYAMHRHPRYWKDPERFDPDRFTPEAAAARPRFAYFPFGAGPRRCIGNAFAMMEAQIILASVARRYRLALVPDHRVEPQPLITLRPRNGVLVTIEKTREDR